MTRFPLFATLASLALVSTASAQAAFATKGQYSQFRNLSGLPGGTVAVDPAGRPGIRGAMAISTPIAYSLRGGHGVLSLANTSYDRSFRALTNPRRNDFGTKSNGTATALAGVSVRGGALTVGMSVVSGAFENSYSVQFTPGQTGPIRFAAGAQGLFAAGGFLGPGFHDDVDRSTNLYGVATADLGNGIYASAGVGTERFAKGFANLSVGLGSWGRALVEHDGFGFNVGLGAQLASYRGAKVMGFAGMLQGRYAFWSVSLAF